MKSISAFALALTAAGLGLTHGTAQAGPPIHQQDRDLPPEVPSRDNLPPQMRQMPSRSAAPLATTCLDTPTTKIPIASSVSGSWKGYSAGDQVVQFPSILTNEGKQWDAGANAFKAICPGLYVLSVSFNTDSYYQNGCGFPAGRYGTDDDVYIRLKKNGNPIHPTDPGAAVGAWMGEQVDPNDAYGYKDRGHSSYVVTLRLSANDAIQAFVSADSNRDRCLAVANFTAFRIDK